MKQPVTTDDGHAPKTTRQPVPEPRADVCGCGSTLAQHAPKPADAAPHVQSGPCTERDCACTGFISEAEISGDAPHSVGLDVIARAAKFDPSYVPPPPPPTIHTILEGHTMSDVPAGDVQPGDVSYDRVLKKRRRGPDPEREAAKEERYGPLRSVIAVLEKKRTSKRVRFDCGHEGAVAGGAKRGRCRVCKKASGDNPAAQASTAAPVKRTPVREESHAETTKQPVREPVRRQPVADTPASAEPAGASPRRGDRQRVRTVRTSTRGETSRTAARRRAASPARATDAHRDRRVSTKRTATKSTKSARAVKKKGR